VTIYKWRCHWRRLVKNIGGYYKPKCWEQKVVIADESMGVSQLWGPRPGFLPKSTHLWTLHAHRSLVRTVCMRMKSNST